ncbi:MAG TPA: class I SAM-dependent methyltransferase [Bacilli bacterium]
MKLSKRLRMIADKIPLGSRLADIGSDHALLPVYLAKNGRITSAIAGEINEGPWEAADKQIKQAGLGGLIEARKGDGLDVIAPGEVDVISIAGMGGSLIVQILSQGQNKEQHLSKFLGVQRLVLQPNVGEDQVRRWLVDNQWVLVDEDIMEEDHQTYEILTADKLPDSAARNKILYSGYSTACGFAITGELLFKMGPKLLKKPSPVFTVKWQYEIHKLEQISLNLSNSGLESSIARRIMINRQIDELKEVLSCLQKDKP